MTTGVDKNLMPRPPGERSLQHATRMGGALYLLIIAAGVFAEGVVRDRLIVEGNAAATARNIAAHPFLFRAGIAAFSQEQLEAMALAKWQAKIAASHYTQETTEMRAHPS